MPYRIFHLGYRYRLTVTNIALNARHLQNSNYVLQPFLVDFLLEVIHCFLARQLTPMELPLPSDEDEDLQVLHMTPSEFDSRLASGAELLDGKSVTAWYRTKQLLNL